MQKQNRFNLLPLLVALILVCTSCINPQHDHGHADHHHPVGRPVCGRGDPNLQPYLSQITGSITQLPLAEPLAHPHAYDIIGHTNASYQWYGGEPYFHHGLDSRTTANAQVRTPIAGTVVNIENYVPNELYWEVGIIDENGFLWQYHHIDVNSIPAQIQENWNQGKTTEVEAGDVIGSVIAWPINVSFDPEFFHHTHLNILGRDESGEVVFLNPLLFLEPIEDPIAPKIVDIGFHQNRAEITNTSGAPYSIFVEVEDVITERTADHNNGDEYIVPPHKISYRLNGAEEVVVWEFNTLPGGCDFEQDATDFYLESQSCGDYDCRRFVVDLGYGQDGSAYPLSGEHVLAVSIADFAGNTDERTYSLTIDGENNIFIDLNIPLTYSNSQFLPVVSNQ